MEIGPRTGNRTRVSGLRGRRTNYYSMRGWSAQRDSHPHGLLHWFLRPACLVFHHTPKNWCGRQELHLHDFRHYPLKVARLLVTPRPHGALGRSCTDYFPDTNGVFNCMNFKGKNGRRSRTCTDIDAAYESAVSLFLPSCGGGSMATCTPLFRVRAGVIAIYELLP